MLWIAHPVVALVGSHVELSWTDLALVFGAVAAIVLATLLAAWLLGCFTGFPTGQSSRRRSANGRGAPTNRLPFWPGSW